MDRNLIVALVENLLAAANAEDQNAARSAALGGVDLDVAERELAASAQAIIDMENPTAEELTSAEQITTAVEMIRSEKTARASQAESASAARDALRTRLASEATAAVETPAAPAPAAPVVAAAETPAPEPEAPAAPAEPEAPAAPEAPAEAPAETAAVAPAPAPTITQIAAAQATDPVTAADASTAPAVAPALHAVAAMDIPNHRAGEPFANLREVAVAMTQRMGNLGRVTSSQVSMETVPVAQFSFEDRLQMLSQTDGERNGLLLMAASNPTALTASGGFCAPRENIYSFFGPINTPEGLAQDYLPTVGTPRGGIQFPVSPDIRDAFTKNPSRTWTAANDLDAADDGSPSKAVTSFTCPSFSTCDVEAQYVILKFGNLATRAFPEWVEHWIRLSMDVHAHKVSAKLISAMVSGSRAVVAVGPNAGATSTLFGSFDLAAADYRNDLKMRRDAPLECWVPNWINDLIRSDLARASKGGLETLAVSDAQIAAWFAARNLIPRTVSDWQDISATKTTGATTWPAGLSFMIFSPGTWVKLDMGTLDLGVVRDSTLNATNDYTMFVETFENVCKVGTESRVYSASICANGAFSADQNLNCNAVDIPGS